MDRKLSNKRNSRSVTTQSVTASVTTQSVTTASGDTSGDTRGDQNGDTPLAPTPEDPFYGHINSTKTSCFVNVNGNISPSVTGDTRGDQNGDTIFVSPGEGGEKTKFSPPSPGNRSGDTQTQTRVSPVQSVTSPDMKRDLEALKVRVKALEIALNCRGSSETAAAEEIQSSAVASVTAAEGVSPVTVVTPRPAHESVTTQSVTADVPRAGDHDRDGLREPSLQEALSKGFRYLLSEGRGENPKCVLEPVDAQGDVYLDETYRQAERQAAAKRGARFVEGDALSLWMYWVLRFTNEHEEGPKTPATFAINIHEYATNFGFNDQMRRWSRFSMHGFWARRAEQISMGAAASTGDNTDVG